LWVEKGGGRPSGGGGEEGQNPLNGKGVTELLIFKKSCPCPEEGKKECLPGRKRLRAGILTKGKKGTVLYLLGELALSGKKRKKTEGSRKKERRPLCLTGGGVSAAITKKGGGDFEKEGKKGF